jgi:hypothetical protein
LLDAVETGGARIVAALDDGSRFSAARLRPVFHLDLGRFQYMVSGFLDTGHLVSRILGRDNQFVKLQLERERIAVLRGLNQEHHKERDDRGSGVNY